MRPLVFVMAAAPWLAGSAIADPSQAVNDARAGRPFAPRVVIEEPRPPSVAIETEGRAGRPDCHSVTISELQDGVKLPRTERQCDR